MRRWPERSSSELEAKAIRLRRKIDESAAQEGQTEQGKRMELEIRQRVRRGREQGRKLLKREIQEIQVDLGD